MKNMKWIKKRLCVRSSDVDNVSSIMTKF